MYASLVYAEGHGVIGYIPREQAGEIQAPLLKLRSDHQVAACNARLIGGGSDKPTLGVVLSMAARALIGRRFGEHPANDEVP